MRLFGKVAVFAAIGLAAVTTKLHAQSGTANPNPFPGTGILLPPLNVEGRQPLDAGTGPVPGYIAKDSTAGTKTDTPLIEVPQSISVISNQQLRDQNSQSVSDALRYAPGLQADSNGFDARADNFLIRGFDQTQTGLFQDGLRLYSFNNQGGVAIEPYGLERIDILRGASSVLYGQSGPGGIVNLISKRPTLTPLHEIEIQLGSYGQIQEAFDFSGPLTSDGAVSYRLTGLNRNSGTQTDYSDNNRSYLAPALTWRPNEDTSLTLLAAYQFDRLGSTYLALPRIGTLLPNPNGQLNLSVSANDPSDFFNRTRYSFGYLFEHRFNDQFTVRQNVRYLELDTRFQQTGYNGLNADLTTIRRSTNRGSESVANFAIDNQLQYDQTFGFLKETILAGIDGQLTSSNSTGHSSPAANINIYGPNTGLGPLLYRTSYILRSDVDQLGLYAQSQSKLWDHLIVTLGVRQDWAITRNEDRVAGTSITQHDSATTWRAGLTYLTDIGIAPYTSYSESFLPVGGTAFSGTPFKPTTGRQFEVGVKYQPQNFNSYMTLAGFDLKQQNLTTADPNNIGFSVQTGEVSAKGVELEIKLALMEGLNLIANYTHLNPEVTKNNDGNVGKQFARTSRDLASTWVEYGFTAEKFAGLVIAGGFRYVGPNFGDDANTIRVPGYALFDAAARFPLGMISEQLRGWRVGLNATNIADKRYVSQCGYFGDGCRYGYGRTIMASLGYTW